MAGTKGTKFKQEIEPHLQAIRGCASELGEQDRSGFIGSMDTMFGCGFTPPECYIVCALSTEGYQPGKYESLPAILPRYFAPDHPVVKPAFDAICQLGLKYN